MAAPDDNLNDDIGPVRWSETWLKLAGFVREKYCSGWVINSVLGGGGGAGWSGKTRPANADPAHSALVHHVDTDQMINSARTLVE